jgi:uncharacterized protein
VSLFQNRLYGNAANVSAYFLDSSAAAKLYVFETGSTWMNDLILRDAENQFFVTRITPIEIAAVIYRRVKAGSLRSSAATKAIETLRTNVSDTFRIVDVSPELSDLALDVAEKFALRGYDCVQLAASLLTRRYREAARQSAPIFVGSDIELNSAARTEGFDVRNPNDFA